jgi:hypothetical protein
MGSTQQRAAHLYWPCTIVIIHHHNGMLEQHQRAAGASPLLLILHRIAAIGQGQHASWG